MKKIKKNELRLEKEVISALTESDLGNVKGGGNVFTQSCNCPPVDHPISYDGRCNSMIARDCMGVSCGGGLCAVVSKNINCDVISDAESCLCLQVVTTIDAVEYESKPVLNLN